MRIPQNIEAEMAVLGCILLDEDCAAEIDRLDESMFYDRDTKEVFKAIKKLSAQKVKIDTVSVFPLVKDKLSILYLLQLTGSIPTTANFDSYVDIIRDMAVRRKTIATLSECLKKASDVGCADFLEMTEEQVFTLAADSVKAEEYRKMSDIAVEIIDEVDESLKQGGKLLLGKTTGFPSLDKYTGGMMEGELIVVAGRPSMGKTAFALNIARNFAKKVKEPITIFSLEMTAKQLAYRFAAMETKIDSMRIRTGQMKDKEVEEFAVFMSDVIEMPITVVDTPGLTMADIRSRARRIARDNGNKMGLVIIDYLQLVRISGKNIVFEYGQVAKEAKEMAKELNCTVILLSQLSRSCEMRNNKRPIMSDLRESGDIEAAADKIIMLYRDEAYYPDTDEKGIAEILVEKGRDSGTGIFKMAWLPTLTLFGELETKRKEV